MIDGLELPEHHDTLDGVAPPSAVMHLHGHRDGWSQLARIVRGGHHGLLIEGEHGIGKASLAFALAHMVLSGREPDESGPVIDPSTPVWRQVAQEVHPNLLYLTRPRADNGTGFKSVISIGEVRRIQRFLGLTSGEAGRRVVIIDPANDMNRNAANGLLKFLEEPPRNTLFLLVTHGAGSLLPTIRSRCQVVRLAPLADGDVAAVLRERGPSGVAQGDLDQLVALSGGSPRHGLVLALYGGAELNAHLESLMAAPRFDTPLAHRLAEVAGKRGNDVQNDLLRGMLTEIVRRSALAAVSRADIGRAERLARLDGELVKRFAVGDAYNLDRKQELLVALADTHAMVSGSA